WVPTGALVAELVADGLPAFPAVAGALDDLTEPAAGLRGVEPIRVGGRALEMIDLPAPEVRAAHVPVPARAVRGQDERALASADEYAYATHALLLSSLLLRRGFRHRLHAGQSLLEFATESPVHVHEEEDGAADEAVVTVHAPRHGSPLALGLERELCRIGCLERLQELELDPDELVRPALRDRHSSLAALVVAGPREGRALARRGTLERILGRRVELCPRRPGLPVVEVVDLREHRRRGRGDHRASLDPELRRL